jgi:hypothetical protein
MWRLVMLKKLMLAGVVALVTILPALSQPKLSSQKWTEYSPSKVGYSIEMPGEWKLTPEVVKIGADEMITITAEVEVNDRSYMSMYGLYPDAIVHGRSAKEILDEERDRVIPETQGKARSEEQIVVGNLPARQFIIDLPNDAVIVLRILTVGNRRVQAGVLGPHGVEAEPDTVRFFSSLKVLVP